MTPTEARQIQADIQAIADKLAAATVPSLPTTSDQFDERDRAIVTAFERLLDAQKALKSAYARKRSSRSTSNLFGTKGKSKFFL